MNGNNGTVNMAGRNLIGVGTGTDANNESKTFAAKAQGGEFDHTLTKAELPAHDHTMHGQGPITGGGSSGYLSRSNNRYSGSGGDGFGRDVSIDTGMRTSSDGGGGAHNNLPPYLAVYFVQRIS
jgi:microcystin-dependent protein